MTAAPLPTALEVTLERFEAGGEPMTTAEVAAVVDVDRQTASERLERLADHGLLGTKPVGADERVWWRPPTEDEKLVDQRPVGPVPDEQDEQFKTLVDATEEYAIFKLDPEGVVQTWNVGAERIKGYEANEIVGNHFSAFYTEEDREDGVPETNLAEAARQGTVEDEGRRLRADGSEFWANVTISAIRDDDGELEGYAKVTRDMTERRRYERQLEAQAALLQRQRDELERELEEVFERISDGFYALDEHLCFLYLNDHATDVLNVDDSAVGSDIRDTVVLTEKFESALYEALETQEPVIMEDYYDPVDRWFANAIYPSESGLSVYFREITEQKERERKLEQYERIVETVAEGIYVLDGDRRFTMLNGAFASMTGYERDELFGAGATTVFDEKFVEIAEEKQAALESGAEDVAVLEEVLYRADGTSFIVESRFDLFDVDGATGRVGVVRDITDRNERERELEESNERLEQFAYAASHDMQEPLRMISSYLQLIDRRYGDVLDDDGSEFFAYAVDGADRMRTMIEGLLQYSRVGTQGEAFEPVELSDVLEDVQENLQMKIEESDAEITIEQLPRVSGDAGQLRQLFQNLLANAIEYSGDEPPRVHVGADRNGSRWTVSVTDDGIGIEPADQKRIFNVFQRLHSHEDHSGAGIGLALCQRIVERHGGELWVDSVPGEGSTFTFTLPEARDQQPIAD